MRKKNIDQINKTIILNKIDTYLPQESIEELNQEDGAFITTELIKQAILDSALNKSPGLDGLPNEFYEALIPRAWYHTAFTTGCFHPIKETRLSP